jgi:hypothetical protein
LQDPGSSWIGYRGLFNAFATEMTMEAALKLPLSDSVSRVSLDAPVMGWNLLGGNSTYSDK